MSTSTPTTPRDLGVQDGDYVWVDADPVGPTVQGMAGQP